MNSNGVYVATVARTTVISSGLPPEIEFGEKIKFKISEYQIKCHSMKMFNI